MFIQQRVRTVMALSLSYNRSKSTSDILDEVRIEDHISQKNSSRVENKYRTYTLEDLEEKRTRFTSSMNDRQEDGSASKSQNFVRKLVASLEKKNEACKADDEFFTRYYRRNDYSNPNTDYSPNANLQRPRGIELAKETSNSNSDEYYSTAKNHRINANFRADIFPKNGVPVYPKADTSNQFFKKENDEKILEEKKKCCDKNSVKIAARENAKLKRSEEPKNSNDSSSFDPNRFRVNLECRMDSASSYFLNGNRDDRKGDTMERIFIKSGEDEIPRNGALKNKVGRNRSFKHFFRSIIKWKKTEEDRARRYSSCDRLFEGSETPSAKSNRKLSRTTSFQAMVFQRYDGEDLTQNAERKATIHPVYGGKRSDEHLEDFARKKENRKYFAIEESANEAIKPSAMRDIAKHLSQLPQVSRINYHKVDAKIPIPSKNVS